MMQVHIRTTLPYPPYTHAYSDSINQPKSRAFPQLKCLSFPLSIDIEGR